MPPPAIYLTSVWEKYSEEALCSTSHDPSCLSLESHLSSVCCSLFVNVGWSAEMFRPLFADRNNENKTMSDPVVCQICACCFSFLFLPLSVCNYMFSYLQNTPEKRVSIYLLETSHDRHYKTIRSEMYCSILQIRDETAPCVHVLTIHAFLLSFEYFF